MHSATCRQRMVGLRQSFIWLVVAGTLPTEPIQLRSFEVFRNACKDVDIVTFDELLAKLEFLEKHLNPGPEQDLF
ncbi:Shedu immune nuclease family protein [Pseudomonas guariconensis]|uniref:hypothetical protein n=1 Tax=Pseudomonas guariconensis TaxID=1288410 RepID=UPI00384A5A27